MRPGAALIPLTALLLGAPAGASDGVVEINAARARVGGVTSSDTAGVPVTLDTPGSYRLTSDLDSSIGPPSGIIADPENFTVIEITADDVTLDLGGFTISGPGIPGTGDGVRSSGRNTVVMNGTIDGVGRDGLALGPNARVRDVGVANAGRDGIAAGASSLVRDCTAQDNAGFGLVLGSLSGFGGNVFTGNNGDNTQPQVKATLRDIHELAPNVCGLDTSCPLPGKLVFAASPRSGALGGLAGADNVCQTEAAAAGLTGSFLAWLSDGTDSPDTRFTRSAFRYLLPSGTPVARDYADLTDGTILNPIDETSTGGAASAAVWSNVTTAGLPVGGLHCLLWTSLSPSILGNTGLTSSTSSTWTQAGAGTCNIPRSIYCFEQ